MFLALIAACSGNPAEEAPAASVEEAPTEVVEAAPAAPAGDAWAVDASTSKIDFVGAKVTGSHDGGFNSYEGKLYVDAGKATGTEFTIDTASVWSDADKLTSHLKDEDFFFVEQFPSATFKSTSIGEDGTVKGILDFRGVSKELEFPATISVTEESATLKAEFSMNRKDWGVEYSGKADNLIEDLVLIKLDLTFPKA